MSYKDIELDESIIAKNKIPLLINNKDWLNLFGKLNNKSIQSVKEKLEETVKIRRNLEREENKLNEDKKFAMKMILGISNAVNNENKTHDVKLLDEYKEKIENINVRLDSISYELETTYEEIRELNLELLKATIYYGYKELKKREEKLKDITEELESLREKTKELINEKYDNEEWVRATYSFLHGMLGWKETDKLDDEILEQRD